MYMYTSFCLIPPLLLAAAGFAYASDEGATQISLNKADGIVVLDAPSNLGLRPPGPGVEPGVKGLPEAMRATGLLKRLGAHDMGRVPAPPYTPDSEPVTGFRNGLALADYSREVATRLSPILASRRFAFVLGGDCSVLLGTGLALRERGRYGLAFIDGHDDFSPPRDPSTYAGRNTAGGRDLALVTGTGPQQLVDIDDRKPYFRSDDVIQIGLSRTQEDREFFQVEQFEKSGITTLGIDAIKRRGADQASIYARQRLEAASTVGFWIHLDADVLDASIMPAVDSPNPRGMTFDELQVVLTRLLASPKAVGMELTIFDPGLDPDGRLARQLADVIVRAFVLSGRAHVPESLALREANAMQNDTAFASTPLFHRAAPDVANNV